jgi:DNA polymerase III epsilon subunit-like protein
MFIDIETTDKPPTAAPVASGDETWPCILQTALLLTNAAGEVEQFVHKLCEPPANTFVHPAAAKLHGIDIKQARVFGMPEKTVLRDFHDFSNKVEFVIGHNILFEKNVILNRAKLLKIPRDRLLREKLRWRCTMQESAQAVNLRRDDGTRKWPTLDEACEALLGEPPRTGKHSAWEDVHGRRG